VFHRDTEVAGDRLDDSGSDPLAHFVAANIEQHVGASVNREPGDSGR